MTKTLKELCEAIEHEYELGQSILDPSLLDLVAELADRTEEIKAAVKAAERYAWLKERAPSNLASVAWSTSREACRFASVDVDLAIDTAMIK